MSLQEGQLGMWDMSPNCTHHDLLYIGQRSVIGHCSDLEIAMPIMFASITAAINCSPQPHMVT